MSAIAQPSAKYAAATRQLVALLKNRARTDDSARFAASFDGSKLQKLPDAVVFPKNDKDIAATLKLANRCKVPVTVRGGGTSLTGSATPIRGGWVIDLSRWKKISFDPVAGIVRVQAGVIVADLHQTVEAAGWFYPPDPASKKYCTIGGNIATNAGGMRGGKYGTTRDYILTLEGFLPTGEKVRWAAPTKKFAAGYNLRDLWIGSEGTLGIVTAATLKLLPKPAARWPLLAAFADEQAAVSAIEKLFASHIQPDICEFLDTESVQCAERATRAKLFPKISGRPVVLLEFAGTPQKLIDRKPAILKWARQTAVAHRQAADETEAEALWTLRRACSSAMFELGDSKLNEDVVIPQKNYAAFLAFLAQLRKKSRLPIPTFGHFADGNFHVNIMYCAADKAGRTRAEGALEMLMGKVVKLGGAISGEHGIGLAKSPFLRLQHTPAEVRAMRAVKQALDPNDILNPGKIFTPFRIWKHPRIQVKLPWDHK